MKNNKILKIIYIFMVLIFCFGFVFSSVLVTRAETVSGLNLNCYLTLEEYNENIASMGLSDNPLYKISTSTGDVNGRFCAYGEDIESGLYEFLNTDLTLNSLEYLAYKIVYVKYSYGDYKVSIYTSDSPFFTAGDTILFYNNYEEPVVKAYFYNVLYKSNNYSFSIGSADSGNNSYVFTATGDTRIDNGVYYKGNGSIDSHLKDYIFYSDGEVHFQKVSWNDTQAGIDGSHHFLSMQERIYLHTSNFEDFEVLAIDRRTLIPSFVQAQISPEDRYINENSRCGLKKQFYYIGGSAGDMNDGYTYELNEYCKNNKENIDFVISYDCHFSGDLYNYRNQLLQSFNSIYGIDGSFVKNRSTFQSDGISGSRLITYSLSDVSDLGTLTNDIYDYFSIYNCSSICYKYDREELFPTMDNYIKAMFGLCGSQTISKTNVVLHNYISVLAFGRQNSGCLNSATITFKVQLVDNVNSSKSSPIQYYTYNLLTGSTSAVGDAIIYDDSDIYDKKDDPDYIVPDTYDPTPTDADTTETSVVVSGGSVNVDVDTNVNTPVTVNNYVTGGGSGDNDDDGIITIIDDDGVDDTDVQGVVDDMENMLDFGNTFFDEFLATIFGIIPVEVWKPFAISAGFISIGAMIRFILKR